MSIIYQNFRRLFLELFCAKAALNVRYASTTKPKNCEKSQRNQTLNSTHLPDKQFMKIMKDES